MGFLDGFAQVGSGAVDGFKQGLSIRQGLTDRRKAEADAQRAEDAKAAIARMFMPQQPDPSAGMIPGTMTPQPMPSPVDPSRFMMSAGPGALGAPVPPMPGQMSLPSAAPAPPLPGGATGAMPTPMAPVAPPGPSVMGMPASPPAQGDTLAAPPKPDGLSGAAAPTGQGFFEDTKKTLQNMYGMLAKANPNMDPVTAFDTIAMQLEQMKGVDESSKTYMLASVAQAKVDASLQIQAAKAESAAEVAQLRADAMRYKADIAADAATRIAGMKTDASRDVAGINAGARTEAAGITADSRRDVAGTQAGASRYRDDKRFEGMVYDSVIDAYVEADKARVGADARVDAALAMGGQKPRTGANAGVRPSPRQGRSTPRGGAPRAAAAPAYRSAQDVGAAYKAGKLTRPQATEILKKNGWAN